MTLTLAIEQLVNMPPNCVRFCIETLAESEPTERIVVVEFVAVVAKVVSFESVWTAGLFATA